MASSGLNKRVSSVKSLPADTTPSSQQNLSIVEYSNFSGGLNTVSKGLNLNDNELAECVNFKYLNSPYGVALETREGLVKMTTVGIGGSIKDIGYFIDASGTDHMVVAGTSLLWEVNTATTPFWAFTTIGALDSQRGRMQSFNNKLVVADGSYLKF